MNHTQSALLSQRVPSFSDIEGECFSEADCWGNAVPADRARVSANGDKARCACSRVLCVFGVHVWVRVCVGSSARWTAPCVFSSSCFLLISLFLLPGYGWLCCHLACLRYQCQARCNRQRVCICAHCHCCPRTFPWSLSLLPQVTRTLLLVCASAQIDVYSVSFCVILFRVDQYRSFSRIDQCRFSLVLTNQVRPVPRQPGLQEQML